MNFDIKNIIIIILIFTSLLFAWKWNKSENYTYKEEINKLKKENEIINKRRDSLLREREILISKNTIIENKNKNILLKISDLEKELIIQKSKAKSSKDDLENLIKMLNDTRKKIENIKKYPPNRKDEYLLNSLKIKSNK